MRYYGTAASTLKTDSSPVTAADHASNHVIVQMLREAFPTDGILSEEMKGSSPLLGTDRIWIVDPLDGTKEFLAQNGEFSIMIGLTVGGEPVVGAVYLPARDVMYSASRGGGAWVQRNGQRTQLRCSWADAQRLRLVGSRSHPDPLLLRIQESLGITDVRPSGSVGVKCALIAEGERDLYIHPVPYMKEWDTCAPEVLIREAGGDITDCYGDPLRYNKPDPAQPHGIVACAPGVAASVLACVSPLFAETVFARQPG
ncbi:MAG: 3'(2'),5'-bisphosphate nucleotidase CysQ [Chloroflexota bacterium]|nr:3'(2'),5'-bisphosphate nucleotidase CysQ [Chloroflexota bacterium]